MINVLFVCMGNICRSPSAEAVMNSIIHKNNLTEKIKCDSAGTISYHAGETADERMIGHASKRGYNLTSIARKIQHMDLDHFDYIITMDDENFHNVEALDVEGIYKNKISKMMKYSKKFNTAEVPDPYYGGPHGFEHVLDLLEDACEGLLEHIFKEHPEIK
ncbi:MAG: low molecular weight protein-tyrosine-phosphatase [Bacteroidota bacterium]